MKKIILLVVSIAVALTCLSCQTFSTTNKNAASEELSKSSVPSHSKEETPEQTTDVEETTPGQTLSAYKNGLTNTTDKDINYEEIYNDFLSGKSEAIDKDGFRRCLNVYLDEDVSSYSNLDYAIYDMNGDEIPELIIKHRISLDIFWIYNNELTLWYSTVQYVRPLNNMALLYERPGSAPEHTNYMYIVLDYYGEELYVIDFSEYIDWNCDGVSDDNRYYIDNAEVTKAIYDSLATQFLDISDDKIEWKIFSYPEELS